MCVCDDVPGGVAGTPDSGGGHAADAGAVGSRARGDDRGRSSGADGRDDSRADRGGDRGDVRARRASDAGDLGGRGDASRGGDGDVDGARAAAAACLRAGGWWKGRASVSHG